jgi:hypothetical protein
MRDGRLHTTDLSADNLPGARHDARSVRRKLKRAEGDIALIDLENHRISLDPFSLFSAPLATSDSHSAVLSICFLYIFTSLFVS